MPKIPADYGRGEANIASDADEDQSDRASFWVPLVRWHAARPAASRRRGREALLRGSARTGRGSRSGALAPFSAPHSPTLGAPSTAQTSIPGYEHRENFRRIASG